MNIALRGVEQAAGVRYLTTGTHAGETAPSSPVLIRYADDLIALCHTRERAAEVKARLAAWLTPRGLAFNEGKTRIAHLDDGVDFLGYNVHRYHGKLLIKPGKAAVRHLRERLAAEVKARNGANATAVISTLNPIIRGWSAYYRNARIQPHVQHAGRLRVAANLPVGRPRPPEQAEDMGHRPILRQVPSGQAGPLDLW